MTKIEKKVFSVRIDSALYDAINSYIERNEGLSQSKLTEQALRVAIGMASDAERFAELEARIAAIEEALQHPAKKLIGV